MSEKMESLQTTLSSKDRERTFFNESLIRSALVHFLITDLKLNNLDSDKINLFIDRCKNLQSNENELPFEKIDKDARELFEYHKKINFPLAGDVACHCLALLQYIGKGGKINAGESK